MSALEPYSPDRSLKGKLRRRWARAVHRRPLGGAILLQAGTRPVLLRIPLVGFTPTRLLSAAGTRPEPAVSVPRAKLTRPRAVATAEPELLPPLMYSGKNALGTWP